MAHAITLKNETTILSEQLTNFDIIPFPHNLNWNTVPMRQSTNPYLCVQCICVQSNCTEITLIMHETVVHNDTAMYILDLDVSTE